jgi:hypothetical protein
MNAVNEQDIEENYQVTLSSYDESGLKILSPKPIRLPSATNDEYVDRMISMFIV